MLYRSRLYHITLCHIILCISRDPNTRDCLNFWSLSLFPFLFREGGKIDYRSPAAPVSSPKPSKVL